MRLADLKLLTQLLPELYSTRSNYYYLLFPHYNTNSTVCLCPQIARANHGGRSYTQSIVNPVIIRHTTILDKIDNYFPHISQNKKATISWKIIEKSFTYYIIHWRYLRHRNTEVAKTLATHL